MNLLQLITETDGIIESIISAISLVVGWLLRKFLKPNKNN